MFAEDNFLVREGTMALLAEVDEIDLVAAVGDPASLLKAVRELTPDAVLTDIRMPPTFTSEGIDAAKRIRAEYPTVGVVVLSQYAEDDLAFDLLSDGVAGLGYLLKERVSQVDELVRALQDVCRGGSALDPKVVEGMLFRRTRETKSPLHDLTDRERDVLAEMAAGRNNAAIAKHLYLSDRAVEKHIGVRVPEAGPGRRGRGQPPGDGRAGLPRGHRTGRQPLADDRGGSADGSSPARPGDRHDASTPSPRAPFAEAGRPARMRPPIRPRERSGFLPVWSTPHPARADPAPAGGCPAHMAGTSRRRRWKTPEMAWIIPAGRSAVARIMLG